MGFQTVVILDNDLSHQWVDDPALGRKIFRAALHSPNSDFRFGQVVLQHHADSAFLLLSGPYWATILAEHVGDYKTIPKEIDADALKTILGKLLDEHGLKIVEKEEK